ncbi:MAG: aldo/keto reductase, partial [Pseudomonadota bacterium]|nr:aldo/keto reductase [Pseudomonadota bacterium]
MEYRQLDDSGLKGTPICLGAMMFGSASNDKTTGRIVDLARKHGVNFIDTADGYSGGNSEKVLGRLLKKERKNWVIATKIGNRPGPSSFDTRLGKRHMTIGIDESLNRLQTDWIDIWYLHKEDLVTPLAETVATMGDIIASGKVLYLGLSNCRSWRMAEIIRLCEQMGVSKPVVCQPYYNAMNRMPEVEVLPACGYYGMGVVPYSPLARGVLTGKYDPRTSPAKGTRAGCSDQQILQTEFRKESLVLAQRIMKHAEKCGMTAGAFATLWFLKNKFVTSVLAGPQTMVHWNGYLNALNYEFIAE